MNEEKTIHYPSEKDYPEMSGELHAEIKPVLVYTDSLGWTTGIRRKKGRGIEWACFNYDGTTLFRDDEVVAWMELPAPIEKKDGGKR